MTGKAEVNEFDMPVRVDHNIPGLNIPVDDLHAVQIADRVRRIAHP